MPIEEVESLCLTIRCFGALESNYWSHWQLPTYFVTFWWRFLPLDSVTSLFICKVVVHTVKNIENIINAPCRKVGRIYMKRLVVVFSVRTKIVQPYHWYFSANLLELIYFFSNTCILTKKMICMLQLPMEGKLNVDTCPRYQHHHYVPGRELSDISMRTADTRPFSGDDRRLRHALGEFYKDKKYFDYYLDTEGIIFFSVYLIIINSNNRNKRIHVSAKAKKL